MEFEKFLKIPLYKLYYIDNVKETSFINDELKKSFEKDYTLLEQKNILRALKFALDNPGYDFKSLLPGIQHSNEDIFYYIKTISSFLLSDTV